MTPAVTERAERADQAKNGRTLRATINGFAIARTVISATAAAVIAWMRRDK